MQYIYYTIAAITLYFASDLILVAIEKKRGKRRYAATGDNRDRPGH